MASADHGVAPALPVIVLGPGGASGSYLLRIRVAEPVEVVFGRFNQAQPVAIPSGDVIYVGSALGGRLGSRLMRHATRSDGSGQAIRPKLHAALRSCDIRARVPSGKRRHWHIDYLLDHPQASLAGVYAIRDPRRLESHLAAWLDVEPHTRPLAPGLGGTDTGATHLFQVYAPPAWWQTIRQRVADWLRSLRLRCGKQV